MWHAQFNTRQEHRAPNTKSSLVLRGVLGGRAYAVQRSTIFVDKSAAGTQASQHNKTILLADNARVDSSPELEILHDNVQCSHGSAVGYMNIILMGKYKKRWLRECMKNYRG